jgi:predicted nucleic acid-binding protein
VTVVVDASVALKWTLEEKHTEDALALWDLWQDRGETVIAPPLFRSEVTNVLHRRGQVGASEADEIVSSLVELIAVREPVGLYARALRFAYARRLGAAYDAIYMSLADFEGCELWTADLKLVRAVQPEFPFVRSIKETPG